MVGQGKAVPPLSPPTQPALLMRSSPTAISWLGGVGAEHYVLERKDAEDDEEWVVVGEAQDDLKESTLRSRS
jgi:hypothetical protein